jgi:hypothetical protein
MYRTFDDLGKLRCCMIRCGHHSSYTFHRCYARTRTSAQLLQGRKLPQMTQQRSCCTLMIMASLCCMIAQRPAVSMQALAVTPERGYIITASCRPWRRAHMTSASGCRMQRTQNSDTRGFSVAWCSETSRSACSFHRCHARTREHQHSCFVLELHNDSAAQHPYCTPSMIMAKVCAE